MREAGGGKRAARGARSKLRSVQQALKTGVLLSEMQKHGRSRMKFSRRVVETLSRPPSLRSRLPIPALQA